jgi:anti-sigma factor RsiW
MTTMPVTEEDQLLIGAYLDGELDPVNALALARRIAHDPALAAEHDRVTALQNVLHTKIVPEAPSDVLRARIEKAVGLRRRVRAPSWMALAASVMAAAVLGSAVTFVATNPQQKSETTADVVVSDHIRALMAAQPIDVASSDKHTVKPWFNGRIPEAPRVVDLGKDDFPLVGGRLDVIGRDPVPTLVYRHRKHIISLTAVPVPGKPDATPAERTDDGYNLVTWTEGGVTYWAVSDVAAVDLAHFAELFRNAPENQ